MANLNIGATSVWGFVVWDRYVREEGAIAEGIAAAGLNLSHTYWFYNVSTINGVVS